MLMLRILLVVLSVISISATAEQLLIQAPDNEIKTYEVPNNDVMLAKIQSKHWKCSVYLRNIDHDPTKSPRENKIYTRPIGCVHEKDSISTVVLCDPDAATPPAVLVLIESGKKTILTLKCS